MEELFERHHERVHPRRGSDLLHPRPVVRAAHPALVPRVRSRPEAPARALRPGVGYRGQLRVACDTRVALLRRTPELHRRGARAAGVRGDAVVPRLRRLLRAGHGGRGDRLLAARTRIGASLDRADRRHARPDVGRRVCALHRVQHPARHARSRLRRARPFGDAPFPQWCDRAVPAVTRRVRESVARGNPEVPALETDRVYGPRVVRRVPLAPGFHRQSDALDRQHPAARELHPHHDARGRVQRRHSDRVVVLARASDQPPA